MEKGSRRSEARAASREGKPMNRNAQRSRRMLEDAYVQMLTEKPYEKITVSDVTRRAGLNRGTFYAHFGGMADLVEDVTDAFSKGLSAIVERVMSPSFLKDPMPVLNEIGEFLSENRMRVQDLMRSNGSLQIVESLGAGVKEQVRGELVEEYGDDAPHALVCADYLAGGILRAYQAWLQEDYGAMPISKVNEELAALVTSTLSQAAGGVSSAEHAKAEAC